MIPKRLSEIERGDLEALVTSGVAENKTLDYKELLPSNSDEDKKEFLADVSAFANASGGDIVFGVREIRDQDRRPTGIPEAVAGLRGVNTDAETLRLENIVRDGLDPRLPSVQFKFVDGFPDGPALVMRIAKSWTAPHMIKFKNWSRFYSRNNAGKYLLEVSEIRSAFALSESLPERIRRFRDDRIGKAIAGETPLLLDRGISVVLHMVPISALDLAAPGPSAWPQFVEDYRNRSLLAPMGSGGWDYRYNFDGFLNFSNATSTHTYTQLFRSGAVEAAWSFQKIETDHGALLRSTPVEVELTKALIRSQQIMKALELTPPIFVMITVLGVKNCRLAVGGDRFLFEPHLIDRNNLFLPDVMLESLDSDSVVLLRNSFDALWQAAGWPKCLDYDEQGQWIKNR